MKDQASYVCDFCGEEIVVPIDLSAGSSLQYVEDWMENGLIPIFAEEFTKVRAKVCG